MGMMTHIFFAELFGACMTTFPCLLMNKANKYKPVCEAMSIGAAVYAAVWMVYPISGAHLNPCISLASLLTRRIRLIHLPIYWTAQFLGTLMAISSAYGITNLKSGDPEFGMSLPTHPLTDLQIIGNEAMITSLLLFVVLSGEDEMRTDIWTSGSGVNVAITYMLIHFVTIVTSNQVTAGNMNPFRSLSAAIVNRNFTRQYCYIIGPLIGSIFGTFFYEIFLSGASCWARTKAWLTSPDFDREKNYAEETA
ncbi:unnamed protein product [Schistocephalus solidus]|uniref:Uncharacterized protein n=1 Tax=Schistocephalus solidus TaxID=70667 RepID=A0A3P7CIR1_SCHSO|nr:unnamed protein product [Schistocephalus solidus]